LNPAHGRAVREEHSDLAPLVWLPTNACSLSRTIARMCSR
jgi:hypothetical protein